MRIFPRPFAEGRECGCSNGGSAGLQPGDKTSIAPGFSPGYDKQNPGLESPARVIDISPS